MKWIKASERLPEIKEGDFDRVYVRQINNSYKDSITIKYLSIHPTWYEWLDESDDPTEPLIAELIRLYNKHGEESTRLVLENYKQSKEK